MSVNIKPINEVPVAESVLDGDMLLMNSGGVAKQIPANKVGGGGSAAGGAVYVDLMTVWISTDEMIQAAAYTDPEMTNPMDYETGKNLLKGAGKLVYALPVDEEVTLEIAAAPLGMLFVDDSLAIVTATGVMFSMDPTSMVQKHTSFILTFSDSTI